MQSALSTNGITFVLNKYFNANASWNTI